MFLPRIVGLRAGEVVYDGPASGLTPEVLTRIYGEEDWTKVPNQDRDEDDGLPVDVALLKAEA